MKILVCDDIRDRCCEVVQAIGDSQQPDVEVTPLFEKELVGALSGLFDSVRQCMDDPKAYRPAGSRFNSIDIIIVDNNLSHLDIKGARLTAEAIAGYLRAFTDVPYIISLNKNPDVDFDLRYLIGDYETRTDLALNTNHLGNPALWTGKPPEAKDDFLPWYWPRLTISAARRRDQIAFAEEHLDESVLATLGLPKEEVTGFLSLHAKGALSPEAELDGRNSGGGIPIEEITYRHVFLARSRSLPSKTEREQMLEAVKEGNLDVKKVVARVVAADIDLWFRRDVLGPQEMLVDLPHLLMRLPFLLGSRAGRIEEWNKAITEERAPFGIERDLYDAHFAGALFQRGMWVPRPCFRWPLLKQDEKLDERLFASKSDEWCDAVFCEDRSTFVERSENAPVEFSAEFEGTWGHRYVAKLSGYHYAPRSRFAV